MDPLKVAQNAASAAKQNIVETAKSEAKNIAEAASAQVGVAQSSTGELEEAPAINPEEERAKSAKRLSALEAELAQIRNERQEASRAYGQTQDELMQKKEPLGALPETAPGKGQPELPASVKQQGGEFGKRQR